MATVKVKEPIRGAEFIVCATCEHQSKRVGAQDGCDVYVCGYNATHIERIPVGADRKVWVDGVHTFSE